MRRLINSTYITLDGVIEGPHLNYANFVKKRLATAGDLNLAAMRRGFDSRDGCRLIHH